VTSHPNYSNVLKGVKEVSGYFLDEPLCGGNPLRLVAVLLIEAWFNRQAVEEAEQAGYAEQGMSNSFNPWGN
jgi:hypothetical protein